MAGSGEGVSKGVGPVDPFSIAEFDSAKLRVVANDTLNADVNEISPFVDKLMGMISQMECAQGKEFEIELALREALANAIVHGCKGDCSEKVQCWVACDMDRGMIIVVRNPGNGFDVDSVPNPTMGENVFSNHGRGIYMINQLMDEVQWKRNGTEIHMVKY